MGTDHTHTHIHIWTYIHMLRHRWIATGNGSHTHIYIYEHTYTCCGTGGSPLGTDRQSTTPTDKTGNTRSNRYCSAVDTTGFRV